ncbi:hypothetical protein QR680_006093 [Steinernema hermaphroditum]|uniref:Mothers against decapentaplegic homolog n=1 Tax=Steinernema hermaphroditum TaxID=289476 RepID=A0AA39HVE1_9BILA|nr:hypothetical protein QR680_006093 [Steinernema hermaphroditum]
MDHNGSNGDSPPRDGMDHRHRTGSCTALTLKQLSLNVNPDHPPSVGEPCGTLVAFLKHFHVGGDDEFTIKAIESLIKKLKDKRNELEVLLRVVAKHGEVPEVSECITIPRTLDGRLQVAGRKGFPHVVYARIWRWPDLHKNELKHVPHCTSAFDMKTDSVCINPFHYERIQSPPVGLGGFDLNPGLGGAGPSGSGLHHQFGDQSASIPSTSGLSAASELLPQLFRGGLQRPEAQVGTSSNSYAGLNLEAFRNLALQSNALGGLNPAALFSNPLLAPLLNPANAAAVAAVQQQSLIPNAGSTSFASTSTVEPEIVDISDSPVPEDHEAPPVAHSPKGIASKQIRDATSPGIPRTLPPVWCRVQYHEKGALLGESFEGRRKLVLVLGRDGGQSALNVGAIDNEQRSEAASKARSHLENGDIVVKDCGDGNITVRSSIPNFPIYVRSCHLNREVQRELCDPRCHQIYPGAEILIYRTCDVLRGLFDYISESPSDRRTESEAESDPSEPDEGPACPHTACNGDAEEEEHSETKEFSHAPGNYEEHGESEGADGAANESSSSKDEPSHNDDSTHDSNANENDNEESDQVEAKRPRLERVRRMDPHVLKDLTSFQLALPQVGPVPATYSEYECWMDFHLVNVERYIKTAVLRQV